MNPWKIWQNVICNIRDFKLLYMYNVNIFCVGLTFMLLTVQTEIDTLLRAMDISEIYECNLKQRYLSCMSV